VPRSVRPHSFRLPELLLDELRRVAERRSLSQTTLVVRYIAEGLKMDEHPMIVFRDSVLGRRAMLQGSRLTVAQVVETIRNSNGSIEEAAEYLSLPVGKVRASVRYYADNRDEVDAYAARVDEENERLRAAWEREQSALVP
jgi:uncharacterized protein (DUF433 family)